jgi:hypothetical protein
MLKFLIPEFHNLRSSYQGKIIRLLKTIGDKIE